MPTFIDFEASSLDLISSFPIEVGICKADGSIFNWLIKPHVLWKDWSEKSESIHGITRHRLEEEGIHLVEVAEALNEHIPEIAYCDAWTFDSFWLHRLFRGAKLKPAFKLESISMLLDSYEVQRWQSTRNTIIEELKIPTHRAANDALILHKTWKSLQH